MNLGSIYGQLDSQDRSFIINILMTYSHSYTRICSKDKNAQAMLVFFDMEIVNKHLKSWQHDHRDTLLKDEFNGNDLRHRRVTKLIRLMDSEILSEKNTKRLDYLMKLYVRK